MNRPVSKAQTKNDLGETVLFKGAALKLDCGTALEDIEIAFRTYGQLNAEKTNAILICHALTMDQHAASENPLSGKPGWWIDLIGAGKIIDTRSEESRVGKECRCRWEQHHRQTKNDSGDNRCIE